jgi:hypothetical protein
MSASPAASQKVQQGEWPATKCATALLYPSVLLCNLKRNIFILLSKKLLVQSAFRKVDWDPDIIMSMFSANLLILWGVFVFFIMYFGLQDTKPPPCPLPLTKQGGSIHLL